MDHYMISVDGVINECEKQGVEAVRKRLLAGRYGEKKKPIVEDWLRQQDIKLEKAHKDQELQLSKVGLQHSEEANKIAMDSNKIAQESNQISRRSNKLAWVAIAISIASPIVTYFIKRA